MAGVDEMNSFVAKFYQLWSIGSEADFHLRCFQGQAYVTLQTALGYTDTIQFKKQDNSARIRRRVKRANARKKDNVSIEDVESESEKDTEQVLEETVNASEIKADTDAGDNISLTRCDEEQFKPSVVGNDISAGIDVEIESEETSTNDDGSNFIEEGGDTLNIKESVVTSCSGNLNQNTEHLSKTVDVYATVMFQNSPFEDLQQEEMESFSRCVKSIDHLARNITGIRVEGHCTQKSQNNRFEHAVQIVIGVKTDNLWECARNYLCKHLGRDKWDRRNGSTISLIRIHQKN